MPRRLRRLLLAASVIWLAVSTLWLAWPAEHGLRAQYFDNGEWLPPSAFSRVDRSLSTARLYAAWRTTVPDSFSVQWSGYLVIPQEGPRTFLVEAAGLARMYLDDALVLEVAGGETPAMHAITVDVPPGAHRVVLHYARAGDTYRFEWLWAGHGEVPASVPSWALTPRPPGGLVHITRWLEPLWWTASGALLLLLAVAGMSRAGAWDSPRKLTVFAARVVVLGALGWLLYAGATEHARRVNTFKPRGDQTAYLWDAQQVYANWHGRTPPLLIGQRQRMPVYAGYLALAYTPRISDDEFFIVAKTWNVRLGMALMAGLAILFAWHLPPLLSFNLTLVVAFGYWGFKAGYSQPELLFYYFFFLTFLACLHMFRVHRPAADISLGAAAGVFAGLTYLTKALVPPFVGLFLLAYGGNEVVRLWRSWQGSSEARHAALRLFAWRATAGAAMAAAFLLVVSEYIFNNKRVFGEYFYNANTTYYMWYDDGARARAIMLPRMDDEGRIAMSPEEEIPSLGSYLRTRSVRQIAGRLADGLANIVARSYVTYWYFYPVLAYLLLTVAVIAAQWRAFRELAARHAALLMFLVAYALVYLTGTAFFSITSSTGTTRFFITHLTPLLFTLSYFFSLEPFRQTRWRIGSTTIALTHVHWAILVALGIGIAFRWWPRLMTTYGGF